MTLNPAPRRRRTSMLPAGALVLAGLLAGCAAIPDVSVSYRPVKWALSVSVVHTLTCNRDNNLALVERGATFLPLYSAAAADPRFRVQLKDLDRFFADADITMALTDDGRLKSINQSTTGQGEAVVKGAISAVAALTAMPAAAPAIQALPRGGVNLFRNNQFEKLARQAQPSDVCQVIREWSKTAPDQLPQVSLVQTAFLVQGGASELDAAPSADQKDLLVKLKAAGLDLSAKIKASLKTDELQPISELKATVASNEVPLTLQRMVALSVTAEDAQGQISSKSAPVPTPEIFVLPIPKAALFGKQTFALTLTEAGRISTIGYGRTSGVPGALGAATAAAGAEVTEDNAEAAALKAAADLIAQQQRYNNCKLKPADCK